MSGIIMSVAVRLDLDELRLCVNDQGKTAARAYLRLSHPDGKAIAISRVDGLSPVRLEVSTALVREMRRALSSPAELELALRRRIQAELAKRTFKILPYHEQNLRCWKFRIEAWRAVSGLVVDDRGWVEWTQIFLRDTPARIEVHKYLNGLGCDRQRARRARSRAIRLRWL